MPAGWFAALEVEQQGIDLTLQLEGPGGRRLTEIDSPNGSYGPETLLLLGEEAQPLRLTVSAPDPQAAPGRFVIRVHELHRATTRDRARCAAERTFARGEQWRRRGGGEALAEAVAEQKNALVAFRALGDQRREADVLDRLGRLHRLRGEAAAASAAYRQAVPLLRRLGARQPLVDALNGLGGELCRLGRSREALACYREAQEIQATLGDRQAEGVTWVGIGRLLAAQGEAERAFRAYDRALAIFRTLRRTGEEGETLVNMGRLYAHLGESSRALSFYQTAALRLESAGRLSPAADALGDLALVQATSGRRKESLATLRRALLLHQRAGNRSGEAVVLSSIGWVLLQTGAADAAEGYCRRSLALFETLGRRADQAPVLANLGQIATLQGRPREALAFLDRALPLLEEAGDRAHAASAQLDRARAWRLLGDLDKARQSAEQALAGVETLRTKPGSGGLRASFLASRREMHELLIDLLIDLHRRHPARGHAAEALAVAERGRARSLLDVLAGGDTGPRNPPPALLAREAEAGRRLAAAQRRLRRLVATGGSEAGQAAAAEVAALQREQERLEAEIRETQDAAGPAVLSPATIGTGIAAPGTLFLEYFLGEKRSFLWAVEPGRLEVFELAPRARLEEAARRVHTLLASADRTLAAAPAEAALSELATLLLAPVADRLAGRRLLIVPDGALAYVPFAALPLPEALVATNEIAVLPSASILAALRRRAGRPSAPQTLAVLADPVFEADDARIPGGGAAAPPRTTTRGTLSDAALPRLPFSQDEAEALLALVPPERRLAALGFAAQRTLVSGGTLARYRLLHFATHAVIDPEHPALSALVLSRISPEGRPQEGFLRAADIARLHLPADLVVLSACRTALGKEVRGEGLMGLTQSFFQAGARRVVVSLWPVDDRATAELMARFYRAMLTSGSTPAAALRAAQASLRREPAWRSPAFWAGFILQGDV